MVLHQNNNIIDNNDCLWVGIDLGRGVIFNLCQFSRSHGLYQPYTCYLQHRHNVVIISGYARLRRSALSPMIYLLLLSLWRRLPGDMYRRRTIKSRTTRQRLHLFSFTGQSPSLECLARKTKPFFCCGAAV